MAKNNTSTLTLDDSLMHSVNLQGRGLYPEKMSEMNDENAQMYQVMQLRLRNKEFDFAYLAYQNETIALCRSMWKKYSSWTKKVLFIGIGGALQTAKMLYNAFPPKNSLQIDFSGNFTDPDEIARLTRFVENAEKETAIMVLSKSGTTAETVSIYLHFKDLLQRKLGDSWKEHILCVTSSHEGVLIKEVEAEGLLYIPASNVGDRFAPFSVLGILPGIIFGMNVETFLKGGRDCLEHLARVPQQTNIAWMIAMYQYLYQNLYGINALVCMIYQTRLSEFNMWLRQLWGESLGKEGGGINLYPALGPKDQHSVLQMFNDGPWFSTFLFISQKKYQNDVVVENHGITELNHLNNKSFQLITDASCRNTRLTLKNYGRPSMHLQFETLDEETMGCLAALFMMVVLYLGELLGLQSVFDQPAVTESRQFIDASMERPGSEFSRQKLAEIEKSIKPSVITY